VPAPEDRFNTGESAVVRLIIDCTRPASHLMLEEPIPAGFDVTDTSAEDEGSWDNWWDYTDVRDDRIVFFIGDLTRGEHEIDYHVRARSAGRYDVMPSMLSGVFDPSVHATGPASRLFVSPGKAGG
jgi:uncharacterized protein YfaS (alpha-2-macroglobulin family)